MWCLGFVVSVERDSGEILTDSSLPGFGSGVGGSVGPVLMGFFLCPNFDGYLRAGTFLCLFSSREIRFWASS